MDVVDDIEQALVAQWSQFGLWPKGQLHEERGVLWFETPIRHLPYNGAIRSWIDDDPDEVVGKVVGAFAERNVDCFWIVHTSARPDHLGESLVRHGLSPVEAMTGMSLDLEGQEFAPGPDGLELHEVNDEAGMLAYTDLTMGYWEIPEDDQELVRELHSYWGPGRAPGHRYVAFADGEPVGKAYLSLAGPPGVASIYGMSVRPSARGRGVARALTTTLVGRAKKSGCHRVVLHSTDMAANLYSRFGFEKHCEFTVYATAALWSDEH